MPEIRRAQLHWQAAGMRFYLKAAIGYYQCVAAIPSAPFFSPARREAMAAAARSGGDAAARELQEEPCLVRFAFCKTDATLDDAAARLAAMAATLRDAGDAAPEQGAREGVAAEHE